MSTPAQIAASIANAQASTGPRTEEGKAASSRNATTHGLFAQRDFIRTGEEQIYSQAKADLEDHLAPAGPLERSLVEEIHRALWRLRRCGEVEATFAEADSATEGRIPDPMQNEATAKLQNSVDRARAQSHRLLHKCAAELRRLQTERQYRHESTGADADSVIGVCDTRAVNVSLDRDVAAHLRRRNLNELLDYDEMVATTQDHASRLLKANAPAAPPVTKRTQDSSPSIGRNSPCHCKSGLKYKRCCGKAAPPLLQAA